MTGRDANRGHGLQDGADAKVKEAILAVRSLLGACA
jgi:hypothetical protein